jgi:hypothetical protein
MVLQFAIGGALYPFIAVYFEDLGIGRPRISLIFVAATGASALLPFLWGWIADRLLAVNRLIALIHLAAALTLLVLGQLEAFAAIFVAFTLYNGLQQPTIALVSALCYHNLDDPARQFGKLRLWGSVGWMLPSVPVFIWMARAEISSFEFVVYLTAALQLLLVLSSPLLPHTPPPARSSARAAAAEGKVVPARPSYGADLRRLFAAPGFVMLLLSIFFIISSFAIMFYWSSPRLREVGVPERYLGLVHWPGIALEIPLFLALPWVLGRIGYPATLVLGGVAALSRHLIYALCDSQIVLVLGSALMAPSVVFFVIAASLAVNALAPREVRATAQSLHALTGAGLGSMSGLLATHWLTAGTDNLAVPFLYAAAAALVGVVLLAWVRVRRP